MSSQAKEEGSAIVDSSSSEAVAPDEIHDNPTDNLVSKLPRREGWSEPLVLYNNYWLRPQFAATIIRLQSSSNSFFKPRHDDIFLATNPKCGTTWLKALAFTISNRSRYEFDNNHPLFSRNPHEVVPFVEIPNPDGALTYLETLLSPRLLATNMPLSLFPKSIASSGCRVVYMCREPKDAFVSRWHFENKICRGRNIELESAFAMFSEGFSPYGPFWDHCLEFWKESIASPDKVFFLKYEEMISEPVKHVTRLAKFLGVPFSAKEEEDGVQEEVVRLCSFENLSSLRAADQTGGFDWRGDIVIDNSVFFRKGKVGDWVNHMSEEMGRELDRIVEDKIKGSGLVL